jgi:YjzC-like protein
MAKAFEAGNKAPQSGVYKALHHREHAQPHYVTLLFGDIFPACQHCFAKVRFELAMPAVHAYAHPLFIRAENMPE